jgi:hypothetical protein
MPDSWMYVFVPDKYNIPIINSRLGKWTDEVPKGEIVKYVTIGLKNYGYEYIVEGQRQTKCKIKGITLDYDTTQKANFDTMKDRDNYSSVIHYPSRIQRHKERNVTSGPQTKTFRSIYSWIHLRRFHMATYIHKSATHSHRNMEGSTHVLDSPICRKAIILVFHMITPYTESITPTFIDSFKKNRHVS